MRNRLDVHLDDAELAESLENNIRDCPDLPAYRLLSARDVAQHFNVDVNTVYVWANRGILTGRAGRYDVRQAQLWMLRRNGSMIRPRRVGAAAIDFV